LQQFIKKLTSKFVHHYQTLINEKQSNNWQIEITEIQERTYGEKERRIDYRKIGGNIEIIENVTIIEKSFESNKTNWKNEFEGVAFKKIEKDIKKMYQ